MNIVLIVGLGTAKNYKNLKAKFMIDIYDALDELKIKDVRIAKNDILDEYIVGILDLGMVASGKTEQEALSNLAKIYMDYRNGVSRCPACKKPLD